MKKTINDTFTFYGMLKLLSVKERIKKRKRLLGELKDISLLDIVNYVKNSIDVIVSFKVEDLLDEYKSNKNENAADDYETLLQKEEAAIRQHISYEHQFKIEYEKLLSKAEEVESDKKALIEHIVSNFFNFLNRKNKIIN